MYHPRPTSGDYAAVTLKWRPEADTRGTKNLGQNVRSELIKHGTQQAHMHTALYRKCDTSYENITGNVIQFMHVVVSLLAS